MAKVLMLLKARATEPTVDEVMAEFNLRPEDMDIEYGVQMIDPMAGDYVILVDEAVAQHMGQDRAGLEGPYSNGEIETFGPPEE
jgi:hypothetical protein